MKTISILHLRSGARRNALKRFAIASFLVFLLVAGVRPAKAQSAKQDYEQQCAGCHGPTGKGNGEDAGLLVSTKMPDITQLAKKNGGHFPFEDVVEIIDGRRDIPEHERIQMPFWGVTMQKPGAEFSRQSDAAVRKRIEALARYIEAMQEK
ncbi:c-type cytochrome [Candidatus Binatus sp.]|uniref:c-type cytochrome n=1 Tax=Candidatus Binatus sp. TaxID=2811406 RepID=UPI003C61E91E